MISFWQGLYLMKSKAIAAVWTYIAAIKAMAGGSLAVMVGKAVLLLGIIYAIVKVVSFLGKKLLALIFPEWMDPKKAFEGIKAIDRKPIDSKTSSTEITKQLIPGAFQQGTIEAYKRSIANTEAKPLNEIAANTESTADSMDRIYETLTSMYKKAGAVP